MRGHHLQSAGVHHPAWNEVLWRLHTDHTRRLNISSYLLCPTIFIFHSNLTASHTPEFTPCGGGLKNNLLHETKKPGRSERRNNQSSCQHSWKYSTLRKPLANLQVCLWNYADSTEAYVEIKCVVRTTLLNTLSFPVWVIKYVQK
jgi:hypothetical protein